MAAAGSVAFDRLQREINLSSVITTPYLQGRLTPEDPVNSVDLVFSSVPTAPEIAAVDAIIAALLAANLPLGDQFYTYHTLLALPAVGTNVVSFVDGSVALIGAADIRHERIARADGTLTRVTVRSDTASAAVTVQLVIDGAVVGSGTTAALLANTATEFVLPLADSLFSEDDRVGIAITGLALNSNTSADALWEEAI